MEKDNKDTWFGNLAVDYQEKTSLVHDLFKRVAGHYDLMNNLMSLGIHHVWKRQLVKLINPKPNEIMADVAGGTGDISFRLLSYCGGEKNLQEFGGQILVCDLTLEMLQQGRHRSFNKGIVQGIEWIESNAEHLPFKNNSLDIYMIVFGLRNVGNITQALKEAHRILKPGGRFFCLEFSKIIYPEFAPLYQFYSDYIIPKLGSLIAQDKPAYQYLTDSIKHFPDQQTLAHLIQENKFSQIRIRNFSAGIAALHTAWKV
ncbi:MAG: bifunctional demethylmenaquinone methyltransferase/2-methoxy-6-polyprenyl-1,4-benzoquinol methylase UbiE [Alphaproteobacteria bacterium]|nr:bifunctional demethylmenaquinone methyltransferase/2-methoxy-6-polyprenyl-1,4-benzoquinol methylase UbiE [Alphaproteobacteria bacterium]